MVRPAGECPKREDVVLIRRAIRGGWLSEEEGRELVEGTLAFFRDPSLPVSRRLNAAKVLVDVSNRDVRQAQVEGTQRRADNSASVATVKALLATPEGRAALLALSHRLGVEMPPDAAQTPPQPDTVLPSPEGKTPEPPAP